MNTFGQGDMVRPHNGNLQLYNLLSTSIKSRVAPGKLPIMTCGWLNSCSTELKGVSILWRVRKAARLAV